MTVGFLVQVANIAEAVIHPRDPNAPVSCTGYEDDYEAANRVVTLPGPLVSSAQVTTRLCCC